MSDRAGREGHADYGVHFLTLRIGDGGVGFQEREEAVAGGDCDEEAEEQAV